MEIPKENKQTFGREYKLKSQKVIDELFKTGKSLKQYPFALQYLKKDLDNSFKIVISAPKRNFRKAHDRNRIKRLMGECVRLNKSKLQDFLVNKDYKVALFLIYTIKEELPYLELMQKLNLLFDKLIDNLNRENISLQDGNQENITN